MMSPAIRAKRAGLRRFHAADIDRSLSSDFRSVRPRRPSRVASRARDDTRGIPGRTGKIVSGPPAQRKEKPPTNSRILDLLYMERWRTVLGDAPRAGPLRA